MWSPSYRVTTTKQGPTWTPLQFFVYFTIGFVRVRTNEPFSQTRRDNFLWGPIVALIRGWDQAMGVGAPHVSRLTPVLSL